MPAGQAAHARPPSPLATRPGLHAVQTRMPAIGAWRPCWQALQTPSRPAEPAVQFMQLAKSAAGRVPDAHLLHARPERGKQSGVKYILRAACTLRAHGEV